jgi:hypothetical protein
VADWRQAHKDALVLYGVLYLWASMANPKKRPRRAASNALYDTPCFDCSKGNNHAAIHKLEMNVMPHVPDIQDVRCKQDVRATPVGNFDRK